MLKEYLIQSLKEIKDIDDQLIKALLARDSARNELYDTLDLVTQIEIQTGGEIANYPEVFRNQDMRDREKQLRLAANSNYTNLKTTEVPDLRVKLSLAEAKLKSLEMRHYGLLATLRSIAGFGSDDATEIIATYLGTPAHTIPQALLDLDKVATDGVFVGNAEVAETSQVNDEVVEAVAENVAPVIEVTPEQPVQPTTNAAPLQFVQEPQAPTQAIAPAGAFQETYTILEARKTKEPGSLRAYCQKADGTRVAVFADNPVAMIIKSSIGRKLLLTCETQEAGLFAVAAADPV